MSNSTLNRRNKSQSGLFVLVSVAMLSAVAFVLMLLEFKLIPSSYLKMDFSDIPAIIGGVFFGPIYSVIIELIKNILELSIKGMGTQMGFGNLMNFVVGCAFSLPYSIIIRTMLRKDRSRPLAVLIASVVSTVITVVVGFFANWLIAPLFFRYFLEQELGSQGALNAAIAATVFNPIKCVILVAIMIPVVSVVMPRIRRAVRI